MAHKALCTRPHCDKPELRNGLCSRHYQRQRLGMPPEPKTPMRSTIAFARAALVSQSDACIMWPYSMRGANRPYGSMYDPEDKKSHTASRWVCEKAHGKPFKSAHACHSCNNPQCVNPRHLRWGSSKDNVQDAVKSGRRATGEKAPLAKLTDALVVEMRKSTESHVYWSKRLGVSTRNVRMARSGRTWKHVLEPPLSTRSYCWQKSGKD